ncbi:MAG: cation transporter [Armatimonadota bacterium]
MKNMLNVIVVLAAVIGVGAILFAAQPSTGDKKPVLTPVTVSVEGLHCQACPDELQKDLAKLPGVSSVKATLKPAQVTALLDETKISVSAFVAAIDEHPQAMDRKQTYGAKLVAYIDAAMCAKQKSMCDACFTEVPKTLKQIKGVSDVTLDKTGKVASISFAAKSKVTTAQITKALADHKFKFTTRFMDPAEKSAAGSSDQGACPMGGGDSAHGDHGSSEQQSSSSSGGCCPH